MCAELTTLCHNMELEENFTAVQYCDNLNIVLYMSNSVDYVVVSTSTVWCQCANCWFDSWCVKTLEADGVGRLRAKLLWRSGVAEQRLVQNMSCQCGTAWNTNRLKMWVITKRNGKPTEKSQTPNWINQGHNGIGKSSMAARDQQIQKRGGQQKMF